MKELMKLLEKKKKSNMSDSEKNLKKDMLKELIRHMNMEMASPMKDIKKVSVMADSKENLEKGLDKAKDLLENKEEPSMDSEEECEMEDNSEEENNEDLSLSDIEEQIKKLEELKLKKQSE